MDSLEQLGLLAELAIALLGFIAVFSIFARQDGKFAASDKHFIQAMVLNCAGIGVFAVLPRVLWNFMEPERVWEFCVGTAVIFGAGITFHIARDQMNMPKEEAEKVHFMWHVIAWSIGAGAFLFLISPYFGVTSFLAAFIGGVSLLFINAMWCFVAIVFRRFF
ncbi:MAG: hypothetical protein ACU84Q_15150 [Gammaproteobacteria bacterium]